MLKTQFVAKIGNDYYFRVWATGAPGSSTGVYTTLPGQNPQMHCVVHVGKAQHTGTPTSAFDGLISLL